MSRHILSLSHEQLTSFALEAFVAHADALNQHHLEVFTMPFPKAPSRWLSPDQFTPRPMVITGALLSTDGQLEPSYSRSQGCTYACQGCRPFGVDEAGQQELRRQCHSGAKRLELTCPFPDVVDKVRQATAKKGTPKDPKGALLELEDVPDGVAPNSDR